MPEDEATSSPITRLSDAQCLSLLRAAAVGRLGFVTAQGVQIIPVGYRVGSKRLLLISTRPRGIIAQLADSSTRVAFEVDYHSPSAREGWSVLVHGVLGRLNEAGRAAHAQLDRPLDAWPAYRQALPVQLELERISGRSVHQPQYRRQGDVPVT